MQLLETATAAILKSIINYSKEKVQEINLKVEEIVSDVFECLSIVKKWCKDKCTVVFTDCESRKRNC